MDVVIDCYQQGLGKPVPLFFQSLSWSRPRSGDSDTPESGAARALGLGADVGLCQAQPLAPGQLGGWESEGLQAHKKKALIPLPDKNAPGSVRREGRCWFPDIHAQNSVILQIWRLAKICFFFRAGDSHVRKGPCCCPTCR